MIFLRRLGTIIAPRRRDNRAGWRYIPGQARERRVETETVSEEAIDNLPGPAKKILSPGAPTALRLMAARGVMPGLKPAEIVTVVAHLTRADEAEVADTARATLAKLPRPVLTGALSAQLPGFVLGLLGEAHATDAEVVEQLLRQRALERETLEILADRADERRGELIATNEQQLLANPSVIEKLYMNKRVRMSTSDRLIELAVRNGLELKLPAFQECVAAIMNELVPEPTPEPTPDDVIFVQADEIARQVGDLVGAEDDTHEQGDDGEEVLKQRFVPLHTQLALMSVSQKVRRAMLGSAAERAILVRDSNRLVARAVVKSPLLREDEAVRISANRGMSDDVLRQIAMNKEFTRNYQVRLNLVTNPRTPLSFASRMVPLLHDHDLAKLAKSKNVSGAIAQTVSQHLSKKKGAKR